MARRARQSVAPLYLLLCLLLGGSVQGILANMALQLIGIGLIAWSVLSGEPLQRPARHVLWIAVAAIGLVALQLVPLPFGLWAALGGRSSLAADYRLLGDIPTMLPASLTPYAGVATAMSWIPPLALFCAIVRLKAYRPSWLCAALVAGTAAGILLGLLQSASADPESSRWYLFPDSSFGFATGFFANANHMAALLVVTLPFLAALAASARGASKQLYSSLLATAGAAALVILVGIALNRSLAGYTLVLPALAGAGLILLPPRSTLRGWAVAAAALLLLVALGAMASSAVGSNSIGSEAASSVQNRADMLATTLRAARDFLPFGSGVGSFPQVYHLYEDPAAVTTTYVSHAHDDYAEVVLELGLGGAALILAFLAWWANAALAAWRALGSQPYARAASVATAILLAHSLVDFPLRTAALGACFAMGAALLADRRTPSVDVQDLRPARHLVFR